MNYIVKRIKDPLRKLLVILDKAILIGGFEPTKENTLHPNSHLMIEERDKFLAIDRSRGGRHQMFRGIFNIFILVYEEAFYGRRVDKVFKNVKDKWKDIPDSMQIRNWGRDDK
uniref:Uncharacterized protein n=1 Tax=viral metagenome TaxID=1070528 RepID=A0A6M3KTR7_9ZZZZ